MRLAFVLQMSDTDCGQACVAMLANTTLEAAIKAVGHNQVTFTKDLRQALLKFGIYTPPRRRPFPKKKPLPSPSLVFFKEDGVKTGHWVVFANGEYWDPENVCPIEQAEYLEYSTYGRRPLSYLPVFSELDDLDEVDESLALDDLED